MSLHGKATKITKKCNGIYETYWNVIAGNPGLLTSSHRQEVHLFCVLAPRHVYWQQAVAAVFPLLFFNAVKPPWLTCPYVTGGKKAKEWKHKRRPGPIHTLAKPLV